MTPAPKLRSRSHYGELELQNGDRFRYTWSEDNPEVYGWVESDYLIVAGTAGWFRTTDPRQAARIAADLLNTKVKD